MGAFLPSPLFSLWYFKRASFFFSHLFFDSCFCFEWELCGFIYFYWSDLNLNCYLLNLHTKEWSEWMSKRAIYLTENVAEKELFVQFWKVYNIIYSPSFSHFSLVSNKPFLLVCKYNWNDQGGICHKSTLVLDLAGWFGLVWLSLRGNNIVLSVFLLRTSTP